MLKLLHPFMPFITEEIWGFLPHGDDEQGYLIAAEWPTDKCFSYIYPKAEKTVEMAMEAIKAIRNIKAEKNVAPSKKIKAIILAEGEKAETRKEQAKHILRTLQILQKFIFTGCPRQDVPEDAVSAVIDGAEIYIPLDDLVDFADELARLEKEAKASRKERLSVRMECLNNPGFVNQGSGSEDSGGKRKAC